MSPITEHNARIRERHERLGAELGQILRRGDHFTLEIGCGHGHFLTAYAAAHPNEACIGIDIELDRVRRAERKRERARLENLHFIRAEARDFLETMPAGACISTVYVLFPDPWPKRRHHKNRLLEPNFLHALARRAGQGTRLYFRTDYEPYFAEVEGLLGSHPDWERLPAGPWPFEEPTVFQRKAARHHSVAAERI